MTYTITCPGPGPHDPTDGILGQSDKPGPWDIYCGNPGCAPTPRQEPLDPAGALATLLVVEGVLPLQDAANAVGQTPEALILEAQAWAAAEEPT